MPKAPTINRMMAVGAAVLLAIACLVAAPFYAFAQEAKAADTFNPTTKVLQTTYSPGKTFDAASLLLAMNLSAESGETYTLAVDFADGDAAAAAGLTLTDYVTTTPTGGIRIQGATTKNAAAALHVTIENGLGVEAAALTLQVNKAKIAFRQDCPTIVYGVDFLERINSLPDSYLSLDNGEASVLNAESGNLFGYGSTYTDSGKYPDPGSSISVSTAADSDAALVLDAGQIKDDYEFDTGSFGLAPKLGALSTFEGYTIQNGGFDTQGTCWLTGDSGALKVNTGTGVVAFSGDTAPLRYDGINTGAAWGSSVSLDKDSYYTVWFNNTSSGELYRSVTFNVREDASPPTPNGTTNAIALSGTQRFDTTDGANRLFVGSDGRIQLVIEEAGSGISRAHVSNNGIELTEVETMPGPAADTWVIAFTLPAQSTAYDTSQIVLWADDNAGNRGSRFTLHDYFTYNDGKTVNQVIVNDENSRPRVDVNYDVSGLQNERYFSGGKQVSITLDDGLGIVQDGDTVLVCRYEAVGVAPVVIDIIGSDFSEPDPITGLRRYTLDCTADGSYEFMAADVSGTGSPLFTPRLQQVTNPNPFIVDGAPPTLTAFTWDSLRSHFNGYGVYASAADSGLHFAIEDSGIGAGLVDWKIVYGGQTLGSGDGDAGVTADVDLPADDRFVSLSDIRVVAHDRAGNALDISLADWYAAGRPDDGHPQGFVVNSADPVLSLSYDNNADYVHGYFNAPRVATLTLVEASFGTARDGDGEAIVATRMLGNTSVDYRTKDFENPSGDGITWVLAIPCEDDGAYSLRAEWTDIALKSTDTITDSFTIDTQAPGIQVIWDNNEAGMGAYYKAARTATIRVRDTNITPEQAITVGSTAADASGAQVSAPGIAGWSQDGDGVWVTTLTCASELHYSLTVSARDMAGNDASPYESGEFVIDMTAPVVRIDRIEDHQAYAGAVAPLAYFEDTNLPTYAARVTINGSARGDTYFYDKQESETDTTKSIDYADLAYELENDDVYTMTAKASDKAGNETTVTKVFSVNRFGSNYILSKSTEDHLGEFLNKAQDVQVTEINVSGLVDNESAVRVAQNADVRRLSDAEYTTRKNPDTAWSEYVYTIPAACFADDAYYRVLINSRDAADNVSENLMDNKNADRTSAAYIEFAVDSTEPLARVFNLESDTSYYAPERSTDIDVADNMKLESAILYVDGRQVGRWDGDDLGRARTAAIDIAAKDKPQTVELRVTDAAGNTATERLDNVIVTNNPFFYWLNTPPLFFGTVIPALVLLAGSAALIIYKRRRYLIEKAKVDAERAAAGEAAAC